MYNLEDIKGKELVLKITGEVVSSNLAEFEETATTVINNINIDLDTDEDFAEAEQNIKDCGLIETRIHNARQNALTSTADIEALITTTGRLEAKFRDTRLLLNKKVKSEKDRRKSEIINNAQETLAALVNISPVKHAFAINIEAIKNAVKNKRSLEKMQESVDDLVVAEKELLSLLEDSFSTNLEIIEKAETDYPGLFPDKNNLALSLTDIVTAQIESRIATFEYKQEMKEKREREEQLKKEHNAPIKQETVVETQEINIPEPPPSPGTPPLPHKLSVLVVSDDVQAVIEQIELIPGVVVAG